MTLAKATPSACPTCKKLVSAFGLPRHRQQHVGDAQRARHGRTVRTPHLSTCPRCGFHGRVVVREEETQRPLRVECGAERCLWSKIVTSTAAKL